MVNNPYAQYKNNTILTASPEELTLMLYDGAIKFCNQAIKAIEEKDIPKAHTLIIRIEDIIHEFMITLDKNYEIAAQLELVYDYIYQRLIEANMRKDIEILSEVREMLKELRDTWKEAMKLAKSK